MSRKWKILIVCAAILLCVTPIVGLIAIYRYLSPRLSSDEIPPELEQARVVVGSDFLARSEFYQFNKKLSWIESIKTNEIENRFESIREMKAGDFDGQPGRDIGLVGITGVTLLDEHGNVKERIRFQFGLGKISVGPAEVDRVKNSFSESHLIDLENDGLCEVLSYGSLDGMSVFNHQGQVVFSRGEWVKDKPSIKKVASGDIDGDGNLDFLANWGYDSSSLELIDRYGNTKWRIEERESLGEMELLDLTGDGKPEFLEYAGRLLRVRDNQGKVIDAVRMPVYLWHLSLLEPDGKGRPQNLAVREGSLWLMDLDGKNYLKWDAPLSEVKLKTPGVQEMPGSTEPFVTEAETVYRARGAWVKLTDKPGKYLAVIASFAAMDRSLLYVYDAQGKLMYLEVLPETCSSIVVIPDGNSGKEEILISGESTVWRYAPTEYISATKTAEASWHKDKRGSISASQWLLKV